MVSGEMKPARKSLADGYVNLENTSGQEVMDGSAVGVFRMGLGLSFSIFD